MAMTASLEAESIDKETAFSLRAFDISSKWVHEGEARFVASAYQEGAIRAHDLIEKSEYPKKRLSELVSSVYHPTQSQPRSNFKRIWVSRGYGEPFLTGRDLFFFRPEEKKFVSRRMKKLHELKLPENTILLTRSGTTGYPVLVGKRLSKFAITDDALRVFPGSAPVGFIYAYLASWFGHALMTKSAYGATVPHLEAAHVLSLEVPMPPDEIIEEVSSSIVRAYSMRDEANILLDDAEEELYKACGSGAFHVDSDVQYSGKEGVRAFSASSTDVGTRFDPKFHIPVVRSAVNKLTSSGCELVSLRKCTNKIFIPARFKREYVQSGFGVPYLLPSQMPMIRPFELKELSKKQAARSPEYLLKEGEVLVSTDGTVGRVDLVSQRREGWFASNNLARIDSSNVDNGFLYVFLSTEYGKHQICKEIYGGVIDHINEKQLGSVLIPMLPETVQKSIGNKARKAALLRDEAAEIESIAVQKIEKVILESSKT